MVLTTSFRPVLDEKAAGLAERRVRIHPPPGYGDDGEKE
jgi:hypothetical protein